MVTALNVSNNILKRGFRDNIDITSMKLQKLIYLVYKQYYKINNAKLFYEPFEVWKYGPVVRSVHEEFKVFKANAISAYAKEKDGSIMIANENNIYFRKVIDDVWEKYKHYGGIPLSEMTHKRGTAWWIAATNNKRYLDDNDIIKEKDYI